ncbi:polysaccharide deacetylase isoform A [Chlorella sorokiniana]|uniref:Polysaccharide deacetylase isoform A n=1 Tax=Chlorella sorokiniana TaxID=3076 RepID=A0A2P6TF01_CHLSO|nr:polysaccharide deacetylase isoform A [Chlorella sorokiniana]|eukprot:PRW32547.1 polysaccharide deacetylase isoform A [Chlorella sorokiniana]
MQRFSSRLHAGLCAVVLLQVAAAAAQAGSTKASVTPPFSPNSANPQFILLTNDDSVTQGVYNALTSVTTGRKSLTGCAAAATLFAVGRRDWGQDCALVKKLYNAGYEVADHTQNHISLRGLPYAQVEKEISEGRRSLAACGIPAADLVGFRGPLLETDVNTRKALSTLGFLYDSTLLEETSGNSVSRSLSQRVYPFSMDNGVPLNCRWFGGIQTCSTSERWPGLYEIPVWNLWLNKTPYSMDYGTGSNAYALLKANFDAAYAGNRAPLPIFVHEPWLQEGSNLAGLKQFVDYALKKPDVYLVTMRQLIGWMKNPIPANRLTPEGLGCGKPGGAYGTGKPGAVRAQSSTPSSSPKPSPSPSPKPSLPVAAPGGACGPAVGARCPINQCCSQYGYCGITAQHCGAGCQKTYGQCNK